MESDNKLFLLDAYALIYRAYYAFIKNPRINSKGFNTSAILGFVNTLEEVLKKENPSHIGVAFDPSGPTFRHEAFEQYKAQREETPEAIRLSVPIIKEIIHAYRIPILEVAGYEADDVIGTLATEAGRQGITTYMMTPDKDYGQLVTDNVFMYRPKHTGGFEVMGIEEVKAKFDIQSPAQVIDMLGLMGDSSDNIPGCPGVGEKTAQKLITEFGSIENLLEHTDQLKGALKTSRMFGAIHEYMIRYQLTIIFVGSHHVSGDTLFPGFCCQSPDYVICFVSRHFEDGNSVSSDDIFYNRYGKADCFRSFFALGFVLLKSFVAERGA